MRCELYNERERRYKCVIFKKDIDQLKKERFEKNMAVKQYIRGMDGNIYEPGIMIHNGCLLVNARTKNRIFVTGHRTVGGVMYWESYREYPQKPCFYLVGSAVLTDIDLELCPRWKKDAVPIHKNIYMKLKEGKVKKKVYG